MSSSSSVEVKFKCYYEGWLNQLEIHLQNLVMEREPNYNTIVTSLISHHKEFYSAKWGLAHDDILAFFAQQWLTPLESAFSWVTGWKPTSVFRLVDSLRRTSLALLTEDQALTIFNLSLKIKSEECMVERELERQQVALGDRNLAYLAQLAGRRGVTEPIRDVKGVLDGFHKVMKMADYVRLKTLKAVLDVLTPKQAVDFLAMFAMLHLQVRKWGQLRAATTSTSTTLTLPY
ncbi:hypothetical protein RND81_08G000900 [Saponaria officinalis]|uniref:DOG1 domain-containing protein n=1 Tax=Saponaria officinalis TaxID=3572 RepID=A0AAW1J1T7_SAPOF